MWVSGITSLSKIGVPYLYITYNGANLTPFDYCPLMKQSSGFSATWLVSEPET